MVKTTDIKKKQDGKKKPTEPGAKDVTIHLSKWIRKVSWRKKTIRAVKIIRKLARKLMKTEDVRLDTRLNKYVWHKGIRKPPVRVRVRMTRHFNEADEEGDMYTVCQHVPVDSFKGLVTENVHTE
eukprot:Trichotokara_eunicae@DN5388_c0_g2_i1.p1